MPEFSKDELQAAMKKIAGLMETREDRGASPAEAESAARLVQVLLTKYGLAAEQVRIDEGTKANIKQDRGHDIGSKVKYRSFEWARNMAYGVAKVCFCQMWWYKHGTITWIGEELDVSAARMMLDWLTDQALTRCKWEWSQGKKTTYSHMTYLPFENQFLRAYGEEMWIKLYDIARDAAKEAQVAGLVVHKDAAIEDFLKCKYPYLYTKVEVAEDKAKKEKKVRPRKEKQYHMDDAVFAAAQRHAKDTKVGNQRSVE